MSHSTPGHHVPVEVKDVLKWRAGVRREPEGRDARIAGDHRGGEHEPTRQVDVGELHNGADVAARDDQHVKRGRLWLGVERKEIRVLETYHRRCFMGGDPAEDAVDC